jgi:ribonuclease HI
MTWRVFTDGATWQTNPGPAGWACITVGPDGKREERSGGLGWTTNNAAELTAALEALRPLPDGAVVKLVTDSQYLQKGLTSWLPSWKKKGWRTSDKKPVKNRELWQALDAQLARLDVEAKWIRGHRGHRHNERCDELASEAAYQATIDLSLEGAFEPEHRTCPTCGRPLGDDS